MVELCSELDEMLRGTETIMLKLEVCEAGVRIPFHLANQPCVFVWIKNVITDKFGMLIYAGDKSIVSY